MDLNQTKIFTLKTILIFVGLVTLYYTSAFIYISAKKIYLNIFPPAPITPESKFGLLPQLKFTSLEISGNPTYKLNTKSGSLPNLGDRTLVYPIVEAKASLLSETTMKSIAKDLQFADAYNKITAADFEWVDGTNKRTLKANIVTRQFNLSTDLNKLSNGLSSASTIMLKDATSKTTTFVREKGFLTADELNTLYIRATPVFLSLGKLQDSTKFPDQAKLYKLDLFRQIGVYETTSENKSTLIKSYKILGANPIESNLTIFVTNHTGVYKFPIIDNHYWQINYSGSSPYFISNISSVWDAVSKGKGVISYAKLDDTPYFEAYSPLEIQQIEIRYIDLAYYEPAEYIPYLQPIYTFEGIFETKPKAGELPKTGKIIIYYPAVRGDWVEKSSN